MGSVELGGNGFSHEHIASVLSPKIQELIILPTERCNFRCTYCYEDFAIGKMKPATQSAIERFMDHRIPELRQFTISWFGGEPLMAKDVVLRLSRYASDLCRVHDVAFRGALTTNAYVLDFELFEELLAYDQREYQITLDGWADGHDVVRRQANGKGSFQRIWANLLRTRESSKQFRITIRIHVRRENYESLVELVENIRREFGDDPRYVLDFQHLRDLGGDGGKTVHKPLTLQELRSIENELRARFLGDARPQPSELPNAIEEQQAVPYICYASKPNSLLIRADGRIGKCTVALDDDRNTVGEIRADGTVEIDRDRLRPWVRGLSDLDTESLECPLSGLNSAAI